MYVAHAGELFPYLVFWVQFINILCLFEMLNDNIIIISDCKIA